MRKRLLLLCVSLFLCSAATATLISTTIDENDGWSWRDGILGDHFRHGDVFGDEMFPGYMCTDCRDAYEHPMDYVAFAYNGFFGENPWMLGSDLGVPFRIYNLNMQWVAVWFEGIIFDTITLLPDTLEVRVRLPNGQILTFEVLQDGPDLPIGDPNPNRDDAGCTCGDDGDGEDDYADPDEGLPEPEDLPEPSGVVSIVDPDEDGEFPEWEL